MYLKIFSGSHKIQDQIGYMIMLKRFLVIQAVKYWARYNVRVFINLQNIGLIYVLVSARQRKEDKRFFREDAGAVCLFVASM